MAEIDANSLWFFKVLITKLEKNKNMGASEKQLLMTVWNYPLLLCPLFHNLSFHTGLTQRPITGIVFSTSLGIENSYK